MTVDLQGACFVFVHRERERGSSSLILRVATFFCWLSWVRRAERRAKGYAWEAEAVSIRLEFSMSWDGIGLPWLPLGGSLIGVIRTWRPPESSVCNRICRTSWKNALRLQFAFVNWSFVFSLRHFIYAVAVVVIVVVVAFSMRVMPPFGICHVWHVRAATWTHAATSMSC